MCFYTPSDRLINLKTCPAVSVCFYHGNLDIIIILLYAQAVYLHGVSLRYLQAGRVFPSAIHDTFQIRVNGPCSCLFLCHLLYKCYRWLDTQETFAVTLLILALKKKGWGSVTTNRARMGSLSSISELLLALSIVLTSCC